MKAQKIRVIGEIELAYQYGRGDVLAITGTNGKTTTTSLLGEIMKNYQDDVYGSRQYRESIYHRGR